MKHLRDSLNFRLRSRCRATPRVAARRHWLNTLVPGCLLPLLMAVGVAAADGPAPTTSSAKPFEFRDRDRILVLGDTFFEREGDYGLIEARLTALFAERTLPFRNLWWAAIRPRAARAPVSIGTSPTANGSSASR